MAKPMMPRFLCMLAGDWGWRRQARQHELEPRELDARPFGEPWRSSAALRYPDGGPPPRSGIRTAVPHRDPVSARRSPTAIEEPGLFLYFPARGSRAPKLRAFIDVARDVLGGKGS